MCGGFFSGSYSSSTLSQCRASCDSSATCMGFSWGLLDPNAILDRRRTLLAHDEPAVAGETGNCYLMTSTPTSSSVYSFYLQAGCYAKSTRLPA